MSTENKFIGLIEVLDNDKTIAVLFLLLSSYAFRESYSFSESAARWPRILAMIAIIGCVLILAQDLLPKPIKLFVKGDTGGLTSRDLDIDEDQEQQSHEFDLTAATFTAIATTVFVVTALAFGFIAATIVFMITYSRYFDLDYRIMIFYTIGLLGIMYLIGQGLNIPMLEGLYG